MGVALKTEAIVLRSFRYGEADRILHLYTPENGRLSAIAKGVRRARSRFGARLEPFFHISAMLHEGRGELYTVTGADTIDSHAPLRESAAALDAAARACDAVGRLFETGDPHPEVFTLLGNELTVLAGLCSGAGREPTGNEGRPADNPGGPADNPGGPADNPGGPTDNPGGPTDNPGGPTGIEGQPAATTANALAFRLKLLLAAGILPQLGSCAGCGERDHLNGFSAATGGVVCSSCESSAFPLGEEAYAFLVGAIGRPLSDPPRASERALLQAERAIRETAEHHAHVRLRPVARAA
jgi:DNA repair protein RecO (recombination protein O)